MLNSLNLLNGNVIATLFALATVVQGRQLPVSRQSKNWQPQGSGSVPQVEGVS